MYCRREARCPGRQQIHTSDGPQWIGAETPRALCDDDTAELDSALGELPDLLWLLNAELPRSLAISYQARVGGTQERKLPLREEVDALMHQLVDEARCWEEIVADIAGEEPPKHRPARALLTPAAGPSTIDRMAASLASSVALLRGRLTVLLALAPMDVDRGGEWETLDGGDAALLLFDLHHRARKFVGQWRTTSHFPNDPCPACGVCAVTHLDGSDVVKCGSCRQVERWDRWEEHCGRAA